MSKPRLVIIGSGWAGFYIADYIDYSKYAVTMISPRRTSAYTPLLASAACGLFNFYLAEENVRAKGRKLRFVKANALDVDFESRNVICAPAFDDDPELEKEHIHIGYDLLVIAPGCMPNTFNTPGVAEHAMFLKNVSDAMAMRKLLFDLLEKASLPGTSEERQRELLHVAIVGGGPTGIELTAELYDLAHEELVDMYPDVARNLHISIYDVAPNILSAYDRNLHEYANHQLLKRDVQVATNTHIESVDAEALHIKEMGRVPYGMLIWATGNKNVPLVEKLKVRTTTKGLKRILTDEHLRVFKSNDSDEIYDNVFGLGDAADMDGLSLPTTAEVAVQKGKYLVGEFNTAGTIDEAKDSKKFEYLQKQLVTYIGNRDGVIAGKEEKEGWTGQSAWLAWRSGSIMWTRSWRNRTMIALTWAVNAIFGKDIARM
ncbi:MAG: hypothetical protein Q9227_003558 [Pyrenula ochraceoflavens]